MIKTPRILSTFILILLITTPSVVLGMAGEGTTPEPYECVSILHTNDIHGHFTPSRATWLGGDSPPMVGGAASYASFIGEERRRLTHENCGLLVLDAGDWFTGTPESDLSGGRPMITALNELPVDATTLGNHEFDVGPDDLQDRIADLDVPVLASNVRYRSDTRPFPGTSDTMVIDRHGIRFGLFGLLLDEMPEITVPSSIEGVRFQDEATRSRAMVSQLREAEVDVIIAITHQGIEQDRELASEVEGIDVIIGSHSHTRLEEPELIDGTIVAQAGSNLTAAGRIDMEIHPEKGTLNRYKGGLVSLYHSRYSPDTGVSKSLQPYVREAEEQLSSTLTRADEPIPRSSTESSPLGNLITDAMRAYTGADLAFQNAYGIRDELSAGPVTLRDLHTILPFGNTLVEMDLTGKQLRSLFEQSATMNKGLIQFSGGTVELDLDRETGQRVVSIDVNGEPIEPDREYRVVTNSFLATGGDQFVTFEEGTDRLKMPGTTLRGVLREHLEKQSSWTSPEERRYEISGDPPSSNR